MQYFAEYGHLDQYEIWTTEEWTPESHFELILSCSLFEVEFLFEILLTGGLPYITKSS